MSFLSKIVKGAVKVVGTAVKVGTGLVAKVAPTIVGNLPIPGASAIGGLLGKVLPIASNLTSGIVDKVTGNKVAAQDAALAPQVAQVTESAEAPQTSAAFGGASIGYISASSARAESKASKAAFTVDVGIKDETPWIAKIFGKDKAEWWMYALIIGLPGILLVCFIISFFKRKRRR